MRAHDAAELARGDRVAHGDHGRVVPPRVEDEQQPVVLRGGREHRLAVGDVVVAMGFSQSTCLPAASAAIDCSACSALGVQTMTTSTSSAAHERAPIGRDALDAVLRGEALGRLEPVVGDGHDRVPARRPRRERACRRPSRSRATPGGLSRAGADRQLLHDRGRVLLDARGGFGDPQHAVAVGEQDAVLDPDGRCRGVLGDRQEQVARNRPPGASERRVGAKFALRKSSRSESDG